MIILDVEIEKAIPPRPGEFRDSTIQYCEGWRDFANMGVTCVCTYELDTHLSRVFLIEDLPDLQKYLAGKATSGFNTCRFDLPLLAHHGVTVDQSKHYDVLEKIWVTLGLDPDHFVYATHGGWSLDAVCEASFGEKKSGNGAMAPVWWQQGQKGRVIDYCLRDVWLEAKLIAYIMEGDRAITNGRMLLTLPKPI